MTNQEQKQEDKNLIKPGDWIQLKYDKTEPEKTRPIVEVESIHYLTGKVWYWEDKVSKKRGGYWLEFVEKVDPPKQYITYIDLNNV